MVCVLYVVIFRYFVGVVGELLVFKCFGGVGRVVGFGGVGDGYV